MFDIYSYFFLESKKDFLKTVGAIKSSLYQTYFIKEDFSKFMLFHESC